MLLHDDAESKDVVHDIFAHLLRESQDLREETAEHYLLTSVRNRCLNVIRSRQIQERVEHLYLLDLDTTIAPTERLEEELKALYKGIDQLEHSMVNSKHFMRFNYLFNTCEPIRPL